VLKILLIGDYSENVLAHTCIPKALALAAAELSVRLEPEWLPTDKITSRQSISDRRPNAIWCVPGSPYINMEGALTAIRYARENLIPFLGTCGGFQHALIEYARNVLGISDADHAESNPGAVVAIISKLQCALVEKSETIRLAENSLLRRIYGAPEIHEGYHCSYGVNPEIVPRLENKALKFSAFSGSEIRAFELTGHPFFVGTLFQPERSALTGRSHPLIRAFVQSG
jgi:CTP synthase (UTP-ammonia lyase)